MHLVLETGLSNKINSFSHRKKHRNSNVLISHIYLERSMAPRSSDSDPINFFVWGYLESIVSEKSHMSIVILKKKFKKNGMKCQ